MIKRYAYPGESMEYVYEGTFINDGRPPEEGMVEMDSQRPGIPYICKNNFDGTGRWEYSEKENKKHLKAISEFKINLYQKLALKFKYKLNLIIATKNIQVFRKRNFLFNLIFDLDFHKIINFSLTLLFALYLFLFNSENSITIDRVEIGILIGLIIDLITIINKETSKEKTVDDFQDILIKIKNLKNMQYVSIGYEKHPFERSPEIDGKALDSNRRKELIQLMINNSSKNSVSEIIASSRLYSNEENFRWAAKEYKKLFNELIQVDGLNYFKKTFDLIKNINSYSFSRDDLTYIPISNQIGAEQYITQYFLAIEKVELFYLLEMKRYERNKIIWNVFFLKERKFDKQSFDYLYSNFPY